MCSRLYNIDEDAYELLQHYIETLRNYFRRQESGEEISTDIEERVAELLDEIKANGTVAITIDHVQDIIKRIGELKDIASDEDMDKANSFQNSESHESSQHAETDSASTTSAFSRWWSGLKGKKFYRDTNHKFLAGVLSGCSNFFGGDVLIWRLAFIILTCCNFNMTWGFTLDFFYAIKLTPIILYAIVAILAPVAVTPEDRLRMKGKKINPQTLSSEVSDYANGINDPTQKNGNNDANGCLVQFAKIIGKMFSLFFIALGILLFIPFLLLIITGVVIACDPSIIMSNIDHIVLEFYDIYPQYVYILAISILAFLFIPAYCSLHCLLNMLGKISQMGFYQRVSWVLMWLLSIVLIVVSSVKTAQFDAYLDKRRETEYQKWLDAHKLDGTQFYTQEDYSFFKEGGWKLLRAENNQDARCTYAGQYFTGETEVRYLDAAHDEWSDGPLLYQAEKTEKVEPGVYRLTAIARCAKEGSGVFIYACSDEGAAATTGKETAPVAFKRLAEVPDRGDKNDDIEATDGEEADGLTARNDSIYILHGSTGLSGQLPCLSYGWTVMTIDNIVISHTQTIHYGVSTVPSFTGKTCTAAWFSATNFKLDRIR